MGNPYAAEISWWKNRAKMYDGMRAAIKPVSFSYLSDSYLNSGDLNGAWNFDNELLKHRDTILKWQAEKAKGKSGSITLPGSPSVATPSQNAVELNAQNDKKENKILALGGSAFRGAVNGLGRVMDLISRPGYAMRTMAAGHLEEARKSGNDVSFWEGVGAFTKPIADLFAPPAIAMNVLTGKTDTYEDAWAGFSGKEKTAGTDLLKTIFPEFTSDHKKWTSALGFGLDVGYDPLTFLTVGDSVVVGSAVKGTGAATARLLGKEALSNTMLDATVWSAAGRQAGVDALKQNIRNGMMRAEVKAEAKTSRAASRSTKSYNRAVKKDLADDIIEARRVKMEKSVNAHEAATEALLTKNLDLAENTLTGFRLAQKAVLNRSLGIGNYNAFAKGVRSGGLQNKATRAIEELAGLGKAKFVETVKSNAGMEFRVLHNILKGMKVTWRAGGLTKTFDVADDFDDFVEAVADIATFVRPVTEGNRRTLKLRAAKLKADDANQKAFISALLKAGRDEGGRLKGGGQRRPRPGSGDDSGGPGGTPSGSGGPTVNVTSEVINVDPADVDSVLNSLADGVKDRTSRFENYRQDPRQQAIDDAAGISQHARFVRDSLDNEQMNVLEEFNREIEAVLANAGLDVGSPVKGLPGQAEPKVVAKDRNKDFADVAYNRALNQQIASGIEEAMNGAAAKLAFLHLSTEPENVILAMQNSVAHILNSLIADTHRQVIQYLYVRGGLTLPPNFPPTTRVGIANLVPAERFTGPNVHIGNESRGIDLTPEFLRDGVTYRNAKGKEVTIPGSKVDEELDVFYDDYARKEFEKLSFTPANGNNWDMNAFVLDFKKLDEAGDFGPYLETRRSYAENAAESILDDLDVQGLNPRWREHLVDMVQYVNDASNARHSELYENTNPAISQYSTLDHWLFGKNADKELGVTEGSVGRLAHNAKFKDLDDSIKAAAVVQGLPRMDPDMLQAFKTFKVILQDKNISEASKSDLRMFIMHVLGPDVAANSDVIDGVARLDYRKLLTTLGIHLDILSNTTRSGPLSIPVRRALADKVWDIPQLMGELTNAVMLNTLSKAFVGKQAFPKIADDLLKKLEQYPSAYNVMKTAGDTAVNHGAQGARVRGTVETVNPTAQPDRASVVAQADADSNSVNVDTPGAPGTNPTATASSQPEGAQMDALSESSGAASGPGGHATGDLTNSEKEEIEAAINKLISELDIKGINEQIKMAEDGLLKGMVEHNAWMHEKAGAFEVRTKSYIRFAGMPLVPLPAITKPFRSYAGVVAMKENQGRVADWTQRVLFGEGDQGGIIKWKLLKPSTHFDASINDMRRSTANFAQNRLIGTHAAIRESYKAYKNGRELLADAKTWFRNLDISTPEKLLPFEERLSRVTNIIRGISELGAEGKQVTNVGRQRQAVENFNNYMVGEWRVPDSVFESGHTNSFWDYLHREGKEDLLPYTREWLNELSTHLNKVSPRHPLATRNLDRLDMRQFDFMVQHALSKMEGATELHISMFDNFTFSMDKRLVDELNHTLPPNEQYVPLTDFYRNANIIGAQYERRWVSKEIGEEMRKVSNVIDFQRQGGKTGKFINNTDYNYGYFNQIYNMWKATVTMFNIPKYHIGNIMSDGFLNLMDGVGVDAYRRASMAMTSHELMRKMGSNPEFYQNLMRPEMTTLDIADETRTLQRFAQQLGDPTKNKTIVTIMVAGKPMRIDSEMIMKLYHEYGLGQTQVNGNILRSAGTTGSGNKTWATVQQLTDGVLDLSNAREDYFRLAHFIHALSSESKIGARSFNEIVAAARDRVIKYHFDYGDVSEFERMSVGRYMPFYKWTKNIIPLTINQFFTNPKTYTINQAANRMMGEMFFPTQEDGEGNAIPISFVTPDWVGDQNLVPIGMYTDPNGNEQARYAVLNLPLDQTLARWIMPFLNPIGDPTLSTGQGIKAGIEATAGTAAASTNPFIVAISQLVTGRTPVPGGSIPTGEDWKSDWMGSIASLIPGVGRYEQWQKDQAKGVPSINNYQGGAAVPTWLDWAGVIRETDQTEANTAGYLRAQGDKLDAQFNKARAAWMAKNFPGVDPNSTEGKKIAHDYLVQQGVLQR